MTYKPDTGLIDLSVRQAVDSVSYSNILPPWFETIDLDYRLRRSRIAERMATMGSSGSDVAVFKIQVPSTRGDRDKTWLMPSVNQQIILHYLALSLSRRLKGEINPKQVYSYNLNKQEGSISFVESQIEGWRGFQEATSGRGALKYLLQIDLQSTYDSISRKRFVSFLEQRCGSCYEIELLEVLLDRLAGDDPGLPLINDSLFYLGNGYLSVVDEAIRRHCPDFIRFVDDYRIFFDSSSELERGYAAITAAVKELGFGINIGKTRAGTVDDYLQAIKGRSVEGVDGDSSYITPVIFSDTLSPKAVAGLIKTATTNHQRYLTEGYGRLLIALLRRMNLETMIQKAITYSGSTLEAFGTELGADTPLVDSLCGLLESFLADGSQTWRVLWLLFVLQHLPDSVRSRKTTRLAESILSDPSFPPVLRVRAVALLRDGFTPDPARVDFLHDLSFEDEGRALARGAA